MKLLAIFREQAGALEERGVDFFVLETFSDLDELITAIDAIRSFSRLPIVANVTFSEEGTTFAGKRPADAWEQLKEKNIQAVGTNCTVGPQLLLPIVREFAQLRLASLVRHAKRGVSSAHRRPHRLSEVVAGILRSCSPQKPPISARVSWEAAAARRPSTSAPWPKPSKSSSGRNARSARTERRAAVEIIEKEERVRRVAAREPESRLWSKIQAEKFVVSVEIDPPKGVTLNRIVEQVGRVMASGEVDSIDINSGTLARVGMDALVLCRGA